MLAETQAYLSARTMSGANRCLIWTGYRDRQGYGRWGRWLAHRRVYELFVGPIPPGMELDHLCRVASCVNPEHMDPVTRGENMLRRSEAQTHCGNGHEFTPENTRQRRGAGRRACRACNRDEARRYVARRAATD